MLDTTSYSDKLPESLNQVLKSFTGCECIMVRKIKDKGMIKGKAGNCHLNVQALIDKEGGTSVSGWLLTRVPQLIEKGLYIFAFHSVWQKPDGKLVDVTEDKNYVGRDKSIFVPDASRVPDLIEGTSYNNFAVFTNPAIANYFGKFVNKNIIANKLYWCDAGATRLLDIDEHSGVYRLVTANYTENYKKLCDEYEIDFVNRRPVFRPDSKYAAVENLPVRMFFDYGLSSI